MAGLLPVMALAASGCAASNDAEGESGASQPTAAEQLFTSGFQLDSANFQNKVRPYVRVPKKNTCYGENISPPLEWKEAPEGTRSFAIVAEDIDHSTGRWVQWVAYNIPVDVTTLPEGVPTSTAVLPDGTTQGNNDHKNIGYNGVCPPPNINNSWTVGTEPPHRLEVTIYALDVELGLAPGASKADLAGAMASHILGEAKTMGKYQPPNIDTVGGEAKEFFATATASAGLATPTPAP